MPRGRIVIDKIGFITSKTFDVYLYIEIEETHAGNARHEIRILTDDLHDKFKEVIMVQHGQEQWTSNNYHDQIIGKNQKTRLYKTRLLIKLSERSRYRAKQITAKMMSWLFKRPKVFSLEREETEWLDG